MKIRTDFVTNSSSSSFVLAVIIKMQDGNSLEFYDYFREDEGAELDVYASPKQLAKAESIDELKEMLEEKVLPWGAKSRAFINQVNSIPSMSRISSIQIQGDETNYLDYKRTYYYNRITDDYRCKIEGVEFEKDGKSGGDLCFSDERSAVEVDDIRELYETNNEISTSTRYLDASLCEQFWGATTDSKVVIPETVKNIADNSFVGDTQNTRFQGIKEIILHSNIESIGWNCFRNLPDLEKITIENNDRYEIINNAIVEKNSQILISYFGKELKEYVIPDGVKYIAKNAFNGALFESVVISDEVDTIGWGAFKGCKKLKFVTLGNKIQCIETAAFESCDLLEKISFPKSVSHIGISFSHCENMIMSVYEGTYAHKYAIKQKKAFNLIEEEKTSADFIRGKNVVLTGFSEKDKVSLRKLIQENCGIIKSSVSSKTDIVIWDTKYPTETSKLREAKDLVEIGKAILIISDIEFQDILNGNQTISMPRIEIPADNIPDGRLVISGVSQIAPQKYKDRLDIISVEIMGDVKEIGDGAFDGCKSLENLILHEGIETIGNSAFYRCEKIENLKIPSTVKTIGSRGFAACKRIKNLVLNNGLQSIGWAGFNGCIALERVVLPDSVNSLGGYIGQGVFASCKNLKHLELSASLRDPSDHLVSRCGKLEKLIIKSSLSYCQHILGHDDHKRLCIEFSKMSLSDFINIKIGGNFVGKREGAKKVKFTDYEFDSDVDILYIPGVMKNIPDEFFKDTGNREIRIDEGVESIGAFAFSGISNTETIYWPKSLKSISVYSFNFTKKIKNIYYAGTKADWSKINTGGISYFGDSWDKDFPTYTIHCSDGDIVVEK